MDVCSFMKRCAYYAGLTKEYEERESDPIEAKGEVCYKNHALSPLSGESDNIDLFGLVPGGCVLIKACSNGNPEGIVLKSDKFHHIDSVEIGDIVSVTYKERKRIVRDYIPPDFSEKKVIKTLEMPPQVVDISRIDE